MELYNGDCLEIMKDIPSLSVDLVIIDPPFGVEYSKGFDDSKQSVEIKIDEWLAAISRVLKNNSHLYIYIPTKEAGMWITEIEKKFNFNNLIATKIYNNFGYTPNNFKYDTQLIAYCSKGKAKPFNEVDFFKTSDSWFNDKRNPNPKRYTYNYPSFIDEFSNTKSNGRNSTVNGNRHPCEKNTSLIELFIKLSSNEGDTVMDCFMGGGSTGIACRNTNRNFIGIELNETYFNIAKKRIEDD